MTRQNGSATPRVGDERRWAFEVEPFATSIGARVHGVNIAQPISETKFADVLDAFHSHAVLTFPNQRLDPAAMADFSRRFGPLEIHHMADFTVPGHPEVRILSNVVEDGRPIGITRGGRYWHTDLSYLPKPALATVLYGVQVPPVGGDTLFADTCAAYNALTPEMRTRIEGLEAVHDRASRYPALYPERPPLTDEQRARVPPVVHPLVRTHPVTVQHVLFLNQEVCSHIVGMDCGAGRRLLEELENFATMDRFLYRHIWNTDDVVVWDNRRTMHRATPFGDMYQRKMYRTQVIGSAP